MTLRFLLNFCNCITTKCFKMVKHGLLFLIRSSQSSIDKKNTKAEEMLTKGPGTFPLERLLAIFQCITSVLEEEDPSLNEEKSLENGIGLMSDVLLQLSTLCNSNFLCKSGNCPLEGSVRYRSMIDEDMALKVTFFIIIIRYLSMSGACFAYKKIKKIWCWHAQYQ